MSALNTSMEMTLMNEAPPASAILVALVVGGILFLLIWYQQRRRMAAKTLLDYPQHPLPCHFLWGNAAQLPDMRKGHHVDPKLLEWALELGPVYNLKVPIIGNMIVVADPALIRYITVTKNYNKSWTYESNYPLFGSSSIVALPNHPHNDEWKRHRKTFAPGFTTTFLMNMVPVMCDKLDRFITSIDHDIETQQPTHMMERTQTFTSDVIVQIAFGEDWGGTEPHAARGYMTELNDNMIQVDKDILVKLFGFSMKRRIRELEAKIDQVISQVLDRRLEQLQKEEGNSNRQNGDDKKNYANVCTLAVDSMRKQRPNGILTEEDRTVIIHQLKTFYFAGHDTTASTISWAAWLLSQHPVALAKLRSELKEKNIFNTPQQRPTYAQLQECEYLDGVAKEVLRMYPPAASARYVADPEESWKGMKLGGGVLYVNCYVTHRLPQYWDIPNDFMPERFVGVPAEDYAHKYIPFLKGPRDCLGKYFAYLEAKLAISALAQRYDMECMDPNESIGYRLTAYPSGGAWVQMKLRK